MNQLRQGRIEREKQKLARLRPGETFTLAFLGILSGEDKADTTPTAQALPDYSGRFGLAAIDFTRNAAVLPNGNWRLKALFGIGNRAQTRMAHELADFAAARGIQIQLIAHSNGVNAAGHFCRRHPVEAALVIAPNTRSERTVRRIERAARRFTLLISDYDERLKQAWFGRRTVQFWRAAFAGSVIACEQLGHGAQCYLDAIRHA